MDRNAADPTIPTVADDRLTVLYDGACPLCRREIGLYQGLTPAQPLGFCDISDPAAPLPADLPAGTTRSGLLARFHVRHADGRLESGARAFIALWERLPYWRWFAVLGRLPGMATLMEIAYRGFLRVRPTMQRWAGKRG
ncbi:MAG: thiol-disulfide oxidoreductase DCC family protein [Gammaproteobacteria bacterium]